MGINYALLNDPTRLAESLAQQQVEDAVRKERLGVVRAAYDKVYPNRDSLETAERRFIAGIGHKLGQLTGKQEKWLLDIAGRF